MSEQTKSPEQEVELNEEFEQIGRPRTLSEVLPCRARNPSPVEECATVQATHREAD